MSVYVKLCLHMLVPFLAVVRRGTKMTSPGLKNDRQCTPVIAYLETQKP
jgi:cytochrome c2